MIIFVYERMIENVLSVIQVSGDVWRIVDFSEELFLFVVVVVIVFYEFGYVVFENNQVIFMRKGKELVEKYGIGFRVDYICFYCQGRMVEIDVFFEFFEQFKEIIRDRFELVYQFDQVYVILEIIVVRVVFMYSRGDFENKEVFVFGDDDFMSVVLMFSGFLKRIVVFDIDERFMKFIEKVVDEIGYENIEIFIFDFRKLFFDYVFYKFDIFIMDLFEMVEVIRVFVGRGIVIFKGLGCVGYFGIIRRESFFDKWREIQRVFFNEFGVVIIDIIRNFNEYVNWGYVEEMRVWRFFLIKVKLSYNWYKSYMFRIQIFEGLKGFEDEIIVGQEFYDDEESLII